MKPPTELCRDARTFLMLYGDDQDAATTDLLRMLNSAMGAVAALRETRRFLETHYGHVTGTTLTGADGLDMDEAYAAQLWREIAETQGGSS